MIVMPDERMVKLAQAGYYIYLRVIYINPETPYGAIWLAVQDPKDAPEGFWLVLSPKTTRHQKRG